MHQDIIYFSFSWYLTVVRWYFHVLLRLNIYGI